jgi:hypothetical protein
VLDEAARPGPLAIRAEQEIGCFARERGFQGWSPAKARLDAQIARANAERRLGRSLVKGESPLNEDALASWDLHDIRRSVETRMAGLGIPKDHVNKVLNHQRGRHRAHAREHG